MHRQHPGCCDRSSCRAWLICHAGRVPEGEERKQHLGCCGCRAWLTCPAWAAACGSGHTGSIWGAAAVRRCGCGAWPTRLAWAATHSHLPRQACLVEHPAPRHAAHLAAGGGAQAVCGQTIQQLLELAHFTSAELTAQAASVHCVHRQQLQGHFVGLLLFTATAPCCCRPAQAAAAYTPSGRQWPSSLWAPLTYVLRSGIARSTMPSKLQHYLLQT